MTFFLYLLLYGAVGCGAAVIFSVIAEAENWKLRKSDNIFLVLVWPALFGSVLALLVVILMQSAKTLVEESKISEDQP